MSISRRSSLRRAAVALVFALVVLPVPSHAQAIESGVLGILKSIVQMLTTLATRQEAAGPFAYVASPSGQQVAAGGNAAAPVGVMQRIDNLANVTITNPTISGGSVNATSFSGLLGVSNGGTGISTAPAYGQLLMGNAGGGYDLVATSSLGISGGASLTGTAGQLAYFSGTDTAVGTSSLFISSSGNVGIGSTTPSSRLSILHSNATTNVNQYAQHISLTDSGGSSGNTATLLKSAARFDLVDSGTYTNNDTNLHYVSGIHTNPTFTGSVPSGDPDYMLVGINSTPSSSGTVGSVSAGLTVVGGRFAPSGNLGTTGNTSHYGGLFNVSGTADVNVGLLSAAQGATSNYAAKFNTYGAGTQNVGIEIQNVSGATNNYGLYLRSIADASTNYALYSDAAAQSYFAGKLGLGTTTPWGNLSVMGTAGQTNPLFHLASSTGASFLTVAGDTGNVGIGTANPGAKLEVVGDIISKGTSWTVRTAAGNDENLTSVTYGNGLFVAVARCAYGGDCVITSPDGVNWTARSGAGGDDSWMSVTYGNGLFVAVSNFGDRVMTSPDGINWTARSAAGNNDSWRSVTYGNGLFVAVSNIFDGGDNSLMTSPDGISWTAVSVAGNNDYWTSIIYGNGLFVAVSQSGDRVMTSPDGITWTARGAAGNDDGWRSITYGNGLFVAVSNCMFGGDCVMTSPDGTNWTARSAAGDDDSWYSITYGNGLFVAASNCSSYGGDCLITSPDGINWTTRSAAGNNDDWNSVTYGNGLFVAVSGDGDRVMTSGKQEQNLWTMGTSTVGTLLQGGLAVQGNSGFGTTTPWRSLSVTGTVGLDGLTGATGAGSLCLSANREVVYNSASDSCLPSLRAVKHDIKTLDVDALAQVRALEPVSFIYNTDASSTVRYGFIAEDASAVDSHFGTYDAEGKLSGVDDRGLIAVVVRAVQSLIQRMDAYAETFTTKQLTYIRAAGDELVTKKLCVEDVCVTRDAFLRMVEASGATAESASASDVSTSDTEAPVIVIQGNNPAEIAVGTAYSDLGVIVTDNVDQNLAVRVSVDGAEAANGVQIDTSTAGEHSIEYRVIDNAGNVATATRTVVVDLPTSGGEEVSE